MDVTRDFHTKQSKSERKIQYDITYMWNLKYGTSELIHKTEADSTTQKTDRGCQGGWGLEREGLGSGDQQMQTIEYRMDRQQVLPYSTGNCIQYPGISHNGKEHVYN